MEHFLTNGFFSDKHYGFITGRWEDLMPMTHLPETRASNPALETRKCDMLSSAGF